MSARSGIYRVCEAGDTDTQSDLSHGKGFFYRWDHLLYRAVHFKYVRKLWTGQRHLRRLVQHASDPAQRDPDGI